MNTKPRQDALWTEDFLSALDDVVRARGSYQQVAGEIWPHTKTAYNKLKNCLNPDHHEKFGPDEIIALLRIGREIGCHTAMFHLCRETGYENPKEAAPRSAETEILERQASLRTEDARLSRELDRVRAAQALKAVK